MMACSLTRGLRRTYSAPTPLGPYSLCPEMLIRSMFISSTSSGILPAACAASVWKKILRARQNAPISAIGWITPISLFTAITETSIVSSPTAASRSSRRIRPLGCTGR